MQPHTEPKRSTKIGRYPALSASTRATNARHERRARRIIAAMKRAERYAR